MSNFPRALARPVEVTHRSLRTLRHRLVWMHGGCEYDRSLATLPYRDSSLMQHLLCDLSEVALVSYLSSLSPFDPASGAIVVVNRKHLLT